jgi:hypothetical protein
MARLQKNISLIDAHEAKLNSILESANNSDALNEQEEAIFDSVLRNRKDDEQHVANFSRTIKSLRFEDIPTKLSVFLSLAIAFNQKPVVFKSLEQALRPNEVTRLGTLLEDLYREYEWSLPHNAEDALTALGLMDDTVPNLRHNEVLYALKEAIFFIRSHYVADSITPPLKLLSDITHFVEKEQRAFNWFGLSFDIRQMIRHLLDGFGIQSDWVIQDGCAGLGLLCSELSLHNNIQPELRLETSNSILRQISLQIITLQNTPQKAQCKLNNPLAGTNAFTKGQADVVLSFPTMPYKLSEVERMTQHPFQRIHYEKNLPHYSSDALWVQYALYNLKPGGLAFLVVQEGFLRRSGYDKLVRQYLIDNNLVEMVISLNVNHARQSQYNQVCLLVLNTEALKSPNSKKDGLTFIDFRGVDDLYYEKDGSLLNLTTLPLWDNARYKHAIESLGLADIRIFKDTDEVRFNDYSLLIENYQSGPDLDDYPSLEDAVKAYKVATKNLTRCQRQINDMLSLF